LEWRVEVEGQWNGAEEVGEGKFIIYKMKTNNDELGEATRRSLLLV
jgi:hypothetical protein